MCGCVGRAFTGDFPEAWRQGKQGVINFTPTYLASVLGSGPQKVRYGTTRPVSFRSTPWINNRLAGQSLHEQLHGQWEEAFSGRDPPHVCLPHHLVDQQSLRSLICVFSLSGSLSQPDRSALIKSGFSICVAACSMKSKAPGWQSPLLSATLPPTTTTTEHTFRQMKFNLHLRYWGDEFEYVKAVHQKLLLKLVADPGNCRISRGIQSIQIEIERHLYPLMFCLHR